MSPANYRLLQKSKCKRRIWIHFSKEIEKRAKTSKWLWYKQFESETLTTNKERWLRSVGIQPLAIHLRLWGSSDMYVSSRPSVESMFIPTRWLENRLDSRN